MVNLEKTTVLGISARAFYGYGCYYHFKDGLRYGQSREEMFALLGQPLKTIAEPDGVKEYHKYPDRIQIGLYGGFVREIDLYLSEPLW